VRDAHYRFIARRMAEGQVIPFLGAGVNLCDRTGEPAPGTTLPSGAELAAHLAQYSEMDGRDHDLVRVSQYLAVLAGPAALYDVLHRVFDRDYPATSLHRFLADLPALLRQGGGSGHQLIVTTNYDDALERAFAGAGEPVDVMVYIADGPDRGKFLHRDPDGSETVVTRPNKYDRLSLDERSVIVKIHGAVDRADPDGDSFVITEDHYIDYLTRTDVASLIPVKLVARLRHSHFLFLGYSLRDWNLRVILHRLWGSQPLRFNSWAVQLAPAEIDKQAWAQRNVQILPIELAEYIAELRDAVRSLTLEPAT
jgi:SIR2-like domain